MSVGITGKVYFNIDGERFIVKSHDPLSGNVALEEVDHAPASVHIRTRRYVEDNLQQTLVQPGQIWTHESYKMTCRVVGPRSNRRWDLVEVGKPINTSIPVGEDYLFEKYRLVQPTPTERPHDRPGSCTRCGAPALVLFQSVECSNHKCAKYVPDPFDF